jgi:hypothetical protein
MRLILATDRNIFICAGSKIYIYDLNYSSKTSHRLIEIDKTSTIIAVTVDDRSKRVFIAYSNKTVYCWDLENECIVGQISLKKRPTAIVWSKLPHLHKLDAFVEVLIVTDKAGDIYAVDAPHLKGVVLLGGHTASVITDLVVSKTHIATSDRDEKIRICLFPRTETIHCYCLGHTNVITSISLFDIIRTNSTSSYLVSSSWDNKVILWDVLSGKCLDTLDFTVAQTNNDNGLGPFQEEYVEEENNMFSPPPMLQRQNTEFFDDQTMDSQMVTEEISGENIEMEEKAYNEKSAGNYPMKVISFTTDNHHSSIAIIFRNLSVVKVYPIVYTHSFGDTPYPKFDDPITLYTNGVPVDIAFINEKYIIAVLEKPAYIQILSISSIEQDESKMFYKMLESSFREICTVQGIRFLSNLYYNNDNNSYYDFIIGVEYMQQVVYSIEEADSGLVILCIYAITF